MIDRLALKTLKIGTVLLHPLFKPSITRLRLLGSMVGLRIHQCLIVREKSSRRENLLLNALFYVHNTFYKFAFGKAADSLEKSNQDPSDCMWKRDVPLILA